VNDIIVIGDLHSRREEPFYSSIKSFMNWFSNNKDFNKENSTVIFLGDLIHFHSPEGDVDLLINDFILNSVKAKKIIILQGNHDIGYRNSGIRLLKADKRVVMIETPTKSIEEGLNCLWLPYYYSTSVDIPSMKEYYENLPEELQGDYDYIFYHIADESQTLFNSFIDLSKSKISGKRCGGHVHMYSKNYLGSSIITRYDERGKSSYIKWISDKGDKDVEVPIFLDYKSVSWDTEKQLSTSVAPFILWTVTDVPKGTTKKDVTEKFGIKEYELYDVEYREVEEDVSENISFDSTNKATLQVYEDAFCKKHSIEGDIKSLFSEYVQKKVVEDLKRESSLVEEVE